MVIEKTINNLKEKPKEDRKAIAGGIAIAVVIVLLVVWAFFFFRKIQRGAELQQLGGGAQDEFNFQTVRDAQQDLMDSFDDTSELLEARNQTSQQFQNTPQYQDDTYYVEPFGGGE